MPKRKRVRRLVSYRVERWASSPWGDGILTFLIVATWGGAAFRFAWALWAAGWR